METCSFKSKSRENVGDGSNNNNHNKVRAKVVLMKKNILDCTDVAGSVIDRIYDVLGKKVTIQLIASHQLEKPTESNLGEEARLEKWATSSPSLATGESVFSATFDCDVTRIGIPGAFIIKNHHHNQFFLKTLTLEDVNGAGRVHFICNSWVYPVHRYGYDRVFFSNKTYLPHQTPESLRKYREQELVNLRGNGEGELKEWDRVYDYAYYNDLGNPDKRVDLARPVLGGSEKYPYPRRGRTGRNPTNADPNSEKRLPLVSLNIYVPRDEQFDQLKFSDFLGYAVKSISQVLRGEVPSLTDKTKNEFDSFEDILKLYEQGVKSSSGPCKTKLRDCIPLEFVKELLRSDGERFSKFPMPDLIKEDTTAWRTDEEFAREMLAGINPVLISRLQEFPPASKLDQTIYGNQMSIITRKHVEGNMNGLTVDEAIRTNRLFILNHHDGLIPYLGRINSTSTKTYATRTILLLRDDGMLMPLAIELSLTHPQGDKHGAVSRVFTPADCGIEGSVWQLAKAYVAVNDSGYHQLVSHWLNTHAVIEPFVIATHRNLSVLHPIYKLLHPHFRDTMHINALARQILINAGGLLETTVFPARYAMEMSAVVYKDWIFTGQALPVDLLKRGVAVEDPTQPHGLRLLIEDYPYAVDGLEIWSAIETWVEEYCSFYYPFDDIVQNDDELQSWWAEICNVGHGDKKHEPWWPRMVTKADLTQTCTIIIWTASALHAAVNFGQYPYAGYNPNRPTLSRRFMPEPGTVEYVELATNPDVSYLRTITPQLQTLLGVSLIEILSRHSSDEVYLGQRESSEWTTDDEPLAAFDRFGKRLMEIEKRIVEMNNDPRWKNRVGPVKVPYTLLYPNTSDLSKESGLTGRGIPNSVSI